MARTKRTVYKSTGEWIPSRPIHGGKGPRQQMITAVARFGKGGKGPRQQMITGCGKKTVRPAGSLTRWQEFFNKASKGPPLQMGKGHGCGDNVTPPTNTWRTRSAKLTSTTEPAATTIEPEAVVTRPNRENDQAPGRPLRLRRHSSRLDPNVWDLK